MVPTTCEWLRGMPVPCPSRLRRQVSAVRPHLRVSGGIVAKPTPLLRLDYSKGGPKAKFVGACQGSRTLVPSPVPERQRFVTLLDLFASGNSLPSDLKTNRLDTLEAWSRHRSSSGTTTDAHADPAQLVSGRAALTARLRKKGGLVGQLRSLKPEARSLPRATCEAF